jgi:cytochrome c5
MSTRIRLSQRAVSVAGAAIALGTLAMITASSLGYDRYNDGCQTCHGSFLSNVSPQGTIFPEGNKHQMHRNGNYMGTKCNLCHMAGTYTNPFVGQSAGTANNPGVGCTGCHGQNYGGSIGNNGAGLRKHHLTNGISVCLTCHTNDPTPLGEGVKPTYYGTADTKCDDACNASPLFKENWSVGDTTGLDNDGDNKYDQADPDCGPQCPPADLSGDCIVGAPDLAIMLGAWGGSGPADLDGSGVVGASDLALLLGAWSQ